MSINPNFQAYSHCGPFPTIDIFRYTAKFIDYPSICGLAPVCQLWNAFIQEPSTWRGFFIEEGIPFVENVDGKPRDYKADFSVLYPMTVGPKMFEPLFGKMLGEMPLISAKCFEKCLKEDPFERGKLMKNTFKLVVVPGYIDIGETLPIPYTIRNLKRLCENPLAGKENMPVFNPLSIDMLQKYNTRRSNKISLCFMRTCIADETRDKEYPDQEALVRKKGFEVVSFEDRVFFDAVWTLTYGTCPDIFGSVARTSTPTVLEGLAAQVFGKQLEITIGGVPLDHDMPIGSCPSDKSIFIGNLPFASDHIGVVPCISAEAPPPPTV